MKGTERKENARERQEHLRVMENREITARGNGRKKWQKEVCVPL